MISYTYYGRSEPCVKIFKLGDRIIKDGKRYVLRWCCRGACVRVALLSMSMSIS